MELVVRPGIAGPWPIWIKKTENDGNLVRGLDVHSGSVCEVDFDGSERQSEC